MSTLEDLCLGATVEIPGDSRARTGHDPSTSARLQRIVSEHNREFDDWWSNFSSITSPEEMESVARYAMARLMLAERRGKEIAELQGRLLRSYERGLLIEAAAENIFRAAGMKPFGDETNRRLFGVVKEILSGTDEGRLERLAEVS
jgi:hypothetical protein